MVADVFPATATTFVGAPETVAGVEVTALEDVDDPAELIA